MNIQNPAKTTAASFVWNDPFLLEDQLSEDERMIRDAAAAFAADKLAPRVEDAYMNETTDPAIFREMGEAGLLGVTIPEEYGGIGANYVTYGLVAREVERVDSGYRSMMSVQSSLVMYPIHAYGSEEQRRRLLPALASGESIGCFGLTESEGGSDPGAMQTRARRDGDSYVLTGKKMWITNGGTADVALVWAKDDDDVVRGFVVPTETPGFSARPVSQKMSLRVSDTAELLLDEVRVPAETMLPGAKGLSAPLACLTQARYGIVWGVLGVLDAVYSEALEFAQGRRTFGKPIAARQLVQAKLVGMLADHTRGLLMAWRLGRLKDDGEMTYAQVSLAKRENVRSALRAARTAREILGAEGITLGRGAIRHMLNLESVDTYEGTHDIHTLVLGRDITGHQAFE